MHKKMICLGFLVLSVSVGMTAGRAEENRPGLSLRETFDLYIRCVQNSDLKGLFNTVTGGGQFLFLTSTGKLIETRDGYYRFHEAWFKEKDWQMPVDSVRVHEEGDWGYAAGIFHYRSRTPEGENHFLDSWFMLVFHKEENMWKAVADVCTPIQREIAEAGQNVRYTQDQVFFFDTLRNRRTVRRFKPDPVPREHILKILDMARCAPTAGNQQPWKFLVITDRKKLDRLKDEALAWYLEEYAKRRKSGSQELDTVRFKMGQILSDVLSAPVYVAVLVDSRSSYPDYNMYDGSLAAGYLMAAARTLEYGTGFFTTFFPEARMKAFLAIPERYRLICFTPIGIPADWPKSPPKKVLEEFVVFEEFAKR